MRFTMFINPHFCYIVRYRYLFEAYAARENVRAYFRHAVRYVYLCKACTAIEGIVA